LPDASVTSSDASLLHHDGSADSSASGGDAGDSSALDVDGGSAVAAVPTSVVAGDGFTCAAVSYATHGGAVYCWGDDSALELGDAGTGFVAVPLPASSLPVTLLRAHAAGRTTCALDAASRVWCWGANDYGQAGAPASASAPPTLLTIDGVAVTTNLLAVGATHACLVEEGSVGTTIACWGDDRACELGLSVDGGDCQGNPYLPTVGEELAPAANPATLAAGDFFTCASSARDEQVRCWGANDLSQCAQAPSAFETSPVVVGSGGTNVSAGAGFGCSLNAGAAQCWGSNVGNAITDDGDASSYVTPVSSFPSVTATAVVAGGGASCVLDGDGGVTCRGTVGGVAQSAEPVGGLAGVTSLAVGNGHVCAIGHAAAPAGAQLWCWGANDKGQVDPSAPGPAVAAPRILTLPSSANR
jgi:alpha-tubulin suppressor-like RCC1 family protein